MFAKLIDRWKRAQAVSRARNLPDEIIRLCNGRNDLLPKCLYIVQEKGVDTLVLETDWVYARFTRGCKSDYTLDKLVQLVEFCRELDVVASIRRQLTEEKVRTERLIREQREAERAAARAYREKQRATERKLIDLLQETQRSNLPLASDGQEANREQLPIASDGG